MLRTTTRTLGLVLAILVVACSDDDNTGPDSTPADALVGSYTTQSFRYTANANPELTVDLAALGAGITALTVNTDATFSGSASAN